MHVLHTDDYDFFREIASEDFAGFGLQVTSFTTNEEALEAAHRALDEIRKVLPITLEGKPSSKEII